MKKVLFVLVSLALAGIGAGTASAATSPGPISNVNYSPKPLYNDEVTVTISFTAGRKARPGYEWGVMMNVYGREPVLSCASILSSWDPNFGGRPKQHMQTAGKHSVLLVGKTTELSYICRGKASVRVVEHKIGSSGLGVWYGPDSALEFRVPEAP